MTSEEFDKLKVGDLVVLSFSNCPKQKVTEIDTKRGVITSVPLMKCKCLRFSNNYNSVELYVDEKVEDSWDELFVGDDYVIYDNFVDKIKNYYGKTDKECYEIEDVVNGAIIELIRKLDKKYK